MVALLLHVLINSGTHFLQAVAYFDSANVICLSRFWRIHGQRQQNGEGCISLSDRSLLEMKI